MQRATTAEKKKQQSDAVQTLRAYFPNGAAVCTQEHPGPNYGSQVRVLAVVEGTPANPQPYVHELTQTAARAIGARTNKYHAIAGQHYTAQDVYQMIKTATGHELTHKRA